MSSPPITDSIPKPQRFKRARTVYPTADEYARQARKQLLMRLLWGSVLALIIGPTLIAALDLNFIVLPFVVLLVIAVPLIFWHYPRAILYMTVGGVCLVEQLPTGKADAITDRIPLFWNVNTIFQTFFHLNFKAVPFNLFECLLILAGVCSLLRAVFSNSVRIKLGPLFWPILAYICFVLIAFGNGMTSGGDFKIALQETRAQFYFMVAYLIAVNLVTEKHHVDSILWLFAISIAVKGVVYTFRRYVTLHGIELPDQGVGSHEEAFFFDCFVCLLISLLVCQTRPNLRNFMLVTLPLVELGNLATNRRAGTAALAILVPVVFLAAYQGFPERRKVIGIAGILFAVLSTGYYSVFKNSQSAIAQPARAIHSQFQPDERDASSNQYRDAENADQMATIKANPLGFGYGKHFIHAVPIADISSMYEWWDILPHNNILWVWMRTGALGFFAFWIMISSAAIECALAFRDDTLGVDIRCVGLFALMVLGSQLIFGLLDLQLVNFRDMTLTAILCGMASVMREIPNVAASSVVLEQRRRDRKHHEIR